VILQKSSRSDRVHKRRFVSAAVIIWLIGLIGLARWWWTTRGPAPTDILLTGVDPNIAPWWELASLPEVGETTAKAIVEFRQSQLRLRGLSPSDPVFTQPSDLDEVRGIGPATLHRIREHVRFPTTEPVTRSAP
jgi:hypothetical protein